MYISRIVIRNFRNFTNFDVNLHSGTTCVIGENNTGKTNLLHAIRLAADATLSSQYRQLFEKDINSTIDITRPQQVVVSLEFANYTEHENECALVGSWEIASDLARLNYRFRPRSAVREAIDSGERTEGDLTLEDYHWELTGGGDKDPSSVEWNEDLGTSVRFSDLQHFQVVSLPALRNVRQELRQSRLSPLGRLFAASDIPQSEKDELVHILEAANAQIADQPTIRRAEESIQDSFADTAGEAFTMGVHLGMADPSFDSIFRSVSVLLTDEVLTNFEPSRNGLGLNNILYISILLRYFEMRVANPRTAGQLLLIEEPEAHLHPQLQRVLFGTLCKKPFQTIITTHSTHISSQAPLGSLIILTKKHGPSIASTVLTSETTLTDTEVSDLERYLDATRSTLIYSRKAILVEGPAELFLIPALVKHVFDIDLDRLGISVIPIYGVHFDVYVKLFSDAAMPKKCAIIADGDLRSSDASPEEMDGVELQVPDLDSLSNEWVRSFRCKTTFEHAITIPGLLPVLIGATEELGASRIAKMLREGYDRISNGAITDGEQDRILADLRPIVLNTAKRFGKARFAQVASKYANLAESVPTYIHNAIKWLMQS